MILLRSYDSRKDPPPEFSCAIWQAGRATSATGLAFKPIQIGQSMFMDEGAMNFNPSPMVLDEAIINEWPGRELGVFVSIGTGKRPGGTSARQHEWWEGFIGGGIGDFAEARRRLISKIEGCEDTHKYMMTEHLPKRGVNPENYYRLNVEVGVGEFGMNEWNRLAEISTNTRRYLARPEVKRINEDAAAKLAKIERAKRRHAHNLKTEFGNPAPDNPLPHDPLAVELPGDEGHAFQNLQSPAYAQYSEPTDKFSVISPQEPPLSAVSRFSAQDDKFSVLSPNDVPPSAIDSRFRLSGDLSRPGHDSRISDGSIVPSPRRSHENTGRHEAPPLPPKTPIQHSGVVIGGSGTQAPPLPQRTHPAMQHAPTQLPYPDDDGPPPAVNMAGKPEFVGR